jgi:hypothetical protein
MVPRAQCRNKACQPQKLPNDQQRELFNLLTILFQRAAARKLGPAIITQI